MTKEVKGLLFLGALGGLAYYLFKPKATGASKPAATNVENHPYVAAPGPVNTPRPPLVPSPSNETDDIKREVNQPIPPINSYDNAEHLYIPDAGVEGPSMDPTDFRFN